MLTLLTCFGTLIALLIVSMPASAEPANFDREACAFEGFSLNGDVQVVDSFPDIKVQLVESFPDLKVQIVDSFPDQCGQWKMVDSFPDLKIQYVESFPDIKVKLVTSFPGWP